MRIAQGRFGRELLTVQDGSVAASATQPALHWRGVGVGTRGQQLIFQKRIESCQAIDVLIPCFLSAVIDRSITKGGVSRRKRGGGENSDKAGAGGTPFSSHLCERLGGKLQAAFSFHCIRVCLLVGAGWQAPLGRRSALQCLLEGEKKKSTMSRWWWFLKELSL